MIRKITYDIRFPFGGIFQKDPKYLFLQKIYKMIHRLTSVADDEKNIFEMISGDTFTEYPSIIVERDFFEKINYKKNEKLRISFYIIGEMEIYYGFITEFFNSCEYINNVYFQKRLIQNEMINNYELYDGEIHIDSPIISIEDIINCINYYNSTYKTDFPIPEIAITNETIIKDYNSYRFGKKAYRIKGIRGVLNVKNYPKIFFETGIGKYSILGGGRSHAH